MGTGHKVQGGWAGKIRGWVTVFMHVKRGGLSKSHASLKGRACDIFADVLHQMVSYDNISVKLGNVLTVKAQILMFSLPIKGKDQSHSLNEQLRFFVVINDRY